jgi:hypothetical protein
MRIRIRNPVRQEGSRQKIEMRESEMPARDKVFKKKNSLTIFFKVPLINLVPNVLRTVHSCEL